MNVSSDNRPKKDALILKKNRGAACLPWSGKGETQFKEGKKFGRRREGRGKVKTPFEEREEGEKMKPSPLSPTKAVGRGKKEEKDGTSSADKQEGGGNTTKPNQTKPGKCSCPLGPSRNANERRKNYIPFRRGKAERKFSDPALPGKGKKGKKKLCPPSSRKIPSKEITGRRSGENKNRMYAPSSWERGEKKESNEYTFCARRAEESAVNMDGVQGGKKEPSGSWQRRKREGGGPRSLLNCPKKRGGGVPKLPSCT